MVLVFSVVVCVLLEVVWPVVGVVDVVSVRVAEVVVAFAASDVSSLVVVGTDKVDELGGSVVTVLCCDCSPPPNPNGSNPRFANS